MNERILLTGFTLSIGVILGNSMGLFEDLWGKAQLCERYKSAPRFVWK